MKKWLQKGLMATVAVLTFGLIAPDHEIWHQLDAEQKIFTQQSTANDITAAIQLDDIFIDEPDATTVIANIKSAAKEQSYLKFGTRIAPVIGDDFEARILPKMDEAIDMTLARLDDASIRSLTVTEKPAGQYSERIFHIKNAETREDVIRFHVRTENRLNEGYYYNFHYHTKDDDFATHYDLGEIYWSKNTPPKWLS